MRSILADPKGENLYYSNQEGFTPTMPERHQSTKRIKKKRKKLIKERKLPMYYDYWFR
jgi:hypothetical protein